MLVFILNCDFGEYVFILLGVVNLIVDLKFCEDVVFELCFFGELGIL